jgi:DNA-binding beta-propeller fold protein YncE
MFVGKDTSMTTMSRHQPPMTRHDEPRIGRPHTGLRQSMKITRLALIATATVAATIALSGCSTTTPTATKPAPTSSSAPAGTPNVNHGSCQINPATAPVPTADPYEPVPATGRISVALSGITSGTVTPGSAPIEVDVTLCNNSPVSYPKVGVVLVLQRCSCAPGLQIAAGTVERFDPATGGWTQLEHPAMGTGMDYLGTSSNVQALPKGMAATLRYRITLDASATDGKGGVSATAVDPDGPTQIGKADLPFTVSNESTTPSTGPTPASRQSVLPFTGLTYPGGVAVDTAGNVYVTDGFSKRVWKLAAGSNTATVLPFTGLNLPGGVAVDTAGDVYVTDGTKRVLKLAAGSNAQTVLPFTGLNNPQGVAADPVGNVYVVDGDNKAVVELAAGSNAQTVLPFTGLNWPGGVAVDTAGNVYVADPNHNRVVELAAGSNAQTVLPITGLNTFRMAVDTAGDVYVTDGDNKQVLKLAAGSSTPAVLPFTGLNGPEDVAVDSAGNVYVFDKSGFGRVVKLAAD